MKPLRPTGLLAAALLALAILSGPLPAVAADDLATARAAFEYGQYERARAVAEALLAKGALTREDELLEAHRIVGLAHFYSKRPDRREAAERAFLQLLSIDPDYQLDPFFTPPAAVTFLGEVRERYARDLRPIREQRRLVRAAQKAQEEMRKRLVESAERQNEARGGVTVRRVTKRHFPVVFLPFGAGQFQNDEPTLGLGVAAVQGVSGLTSVVCYSVIEGLRQPGTGGFARNDLALANTLDVLKWASAGIFFVTWGYGVADAWSKYEPETVVEEVIPPAEKAQPVAAEPAASSAPSPGPPLPVAFAPFVAPVEDGGLLGLSLRF